MYIDSYVFIISLIGMTVLLTYKVIAIRAYDRVNKNYLHFDPFPKTRVYVAGLVYRIASFVRYQIIIPAWKSLVKNIIYIVRGARVSLYDMRNGRKKLGDMIETNGDASGYVQKIIDQKKKIQRKLKKELKDLEE